MAVWQYVFIGVVFVLLVALVAPNLRHIRWRAHGVMLLALVVLAAMWAVEYSGVAVLGVQNLTVVALVFVTFVYAVSTDRIARETARQRKASEKQLELLRDQQANAVAPLIMLEATMYMSGTVKVEFANAGVGPALNLRIWVEDTECPELRGAQRALARSVVGTGRAELEGFIATGKDDYRLGPSVLRAQYEDVFGKTYESGLIFPPNALPEFKYGPAREKIVF